MGWEIIMRNKLLCEGTSNFWSMDKLPLLIFEDYDYVFDRVYDMTKEEIQDKIESGEVDEYEISDTPEFEKIWNKYFDYCVLTEYEQDDLQSDVNDFNYDCAHSDDYDPYEDEEVKVEVKPGYYEAAQLYCNTKYLNEKQIESVKKFFAEMKQKYGLTELGVSYRFSNGETGYHKVNESIDVCRISAKQRKELNTICRKYCGWKLPKEISNLWEELSNYGVDVGLLTGYGDSNGAGSRSWTKSFTYDGITVDNSAFVFSVYEGNPNTLKNEYLIYFS